MLTARGYTPLTLPPVLLDLLPDDLRREYADVQTAQERIRQARDDAAQAESAAQTADADDRRAARAAVEAGKPIPKPTIETTAATAVVKRREVRALEEIVSDTEADVLAGIERIRPDLTDAARDRASADANTAREALDTFAAAVRGVAEASSLWLWLRSGEGITPRVNPRMEVVLNGVGQDAATLAATIADTITTRLPEAIEARERAAQEERDRLALTPQVVPGVVADSAGWREVTS